MGEKQYFLYLLVLKTVQETAKIFCIRHVLQIRKPEAHLQENYFQPVSAALSSGRRVIPNSGNFLIRFRGVIVINY